MIDVGDAGHVDAAGDDVGGDEHPDLAVAEGVERALAGVLRLVAVDHLGGDAVLDEVLRHPVGAALGAGEDDGAADLGRRRRARRGGARLARGLDRLDALVDALDGGRLRRDLDADRVLEEAARRGSATSAGMVAENSADWRRGCSAATILRTGWMKPMSSMRSASSSTTKRVWSSTIERSSIRSVSRPGVATTTSTPRAIAATWALRDMPPSTSSVESRAPPAKRAEARLDLHRELAGRREDQRAAGLRRRPLPELEELVQDRQREGRGLAGAGLGDAEDVAARELRRDRLGLDRRRRVEAGAGERRW